MKKIDKKNIMPGVPEPLGSIITSSGVNFAVFSRHATQVTLALFKPESKKCFRRIKLDPAINRTGNIWHVQVFGLEAGVEYGYYLDGPNDPEGEGHLFDSKTLLTDPYAKIMVKGYGQNPSFIHDPGFNNYRSLVVNDSFDWEGDRPLQIPLVDTIIYELHVRGFTRHPESGVKSPGTFEGLIEKIPYLKKLGITAVELMPVTEFNKYDNIHLNPETNENLTNFWGYSPISFFAVNSDYSSKTQGYNPVIAFKEMVKAFHDAGIEVILDMVLNHTGEGSLDGPVLNFKGLDNSIYYLLSPEKEYLNFSGCGNTFNCNHPLVRNLIMDCLRYWVIEMHVDGFRFDLASILGRDQKGEVLSNPPMVEQIAEDPILANTKIIAEAWDAAGLYQVGSFSENPRWAEWNGHFRDDVRSFMCGAQGSVPGLATRIAGSSDLYQSSSRLPTNSINFITSHDGFTLHDLVSYNHKRNFANGEDSRDGCDHNISWNSGVEGETQDKKIIKFRERRIRTMALILFLSQGTPMLLAGDEFGRTQNGNNNAYCQDNQTSWVDWSLAKNNKGLLRFFKELIAFRKRYPLFRRNDFFHEPGSEGLKEIIWQSIKKDSTDWSGPCKTLAFFLDGRSDSSKNNFFVMLNSHNSYKLFEPPHLNGKKIWKRIIDTSLESPKNIVSEKKAIALRGKKVRVAGMGAVVLISQNK
jgi:isoamylase